MRCCHAADRAHDRVAFAAASFANEVRSAPNGSDAPILRTSQRNGLSNPKKSAFQSFGAYHSTTGAGATRTLAPDLGQFIPLFRLPVNR